MQDENNSSALVKFTAPGRVSRASSETKCTVRKITGVQIINRSIQG